MGSNTTNPSPVDPRDRRIVLLGKTGGGKSSSGNTIFGGKKKFHADLSPESITDQCKSESRNIDGRKITLIDTPGFIDTKMDDKVLKDGIAHFLIDSAEGIHAFLIVLQVGRYTEQEKAIISESKDMFSEDVFKYATVLFTRGDDLEGKTIQDFVKESDALRKLVQKCGDRCHVIDNRHWKKNGKNKVQVAELLKTIDQMVEKNGGNCYTNELLQTVQEGIEEEKMLMRKSGSKLSEEEIHREAKKRVKAKLHVRLAGMITGALLGAAFGAMKIFSKTTVEEKLQALGGVLTGGFIGYGAAGDAQTVVEAIEAAATKVYDKTVKSESKSESEPGSESESESGSGSESGSDSGSGSESESESGSGSESE